MFSRHFLVYLCLAAAMLGFSASARASELFHITSQEYEINIYMARQC